MAMGWRQADCLRKLLENGGIWSTDCGWFYGESAAATLRLLQTLERRGLVAMKPAVAHLEWHIVDVERAYAAIAKNNLSVTDEVSAVEYLGAKILVVPNDEWNVKITYPRDLLLAQAVLARRSS